MIHSVAFPTPFSVAVLPSWHKAGAHSVLDPSVLGCRLVYAFIIQHCDLRSAATTSTGTIPRTLVTNNTTRPPSPPAPFRFSGHPSPAFSSQIEFIVPNLLIDAQMGSFCARGAVGPRVGRPGGNVEGRTNAGPATLRQAER